MHISITKHRSNLPDEIQYCLLKG